MLEVFGVIINLPSMIRLDWLDPRDLSLHRDHRSVHGSHGGLYNTPPIFAVTVFVTDATEACIIAWSSLKSILFTKSPLADFVF